MAPEPHYIDVDLKRDTNYKLFSVTQNDTDVTLIIRVSDDGLITDTLLDHFTTVTLTSERPIDRKSFYTSGERIVGTNEIRFKLGTSEIAHVGVVNASVQLYSIDGRVSTAHFSYKVRKDHSEQVVPTVNEASLIERVLVDGPRIMTEAEAAILANTQATAKLETDKAAALQEMATATAGANQAAATADQERVRMVDEVTQTMVDVDGVMTYISSDFLPSTAQAIADMDLVVQDGNTKATDALDKATTAKTVAETVRTEFDQVIAEAGSNNPEVVNARGTYATLKQRLDNTDQKLVDSDRQTQMLQQGANILNADVATPVDFEVQGRTLTSLANSNLESLKYYALADRKSKVIVDGVTVAGIGKFQKKSTTLTTADFAGKVVGSTTVNPHVMKIGFNAVLQPPTYHNFEDPYSAVMTLDGTRKISFTSTSGAFPQHLFSFNIIEQVERQLGLIPKTTVAEKVQWIKDNVNRLTANWHGFGSGPAGNKATLSIWEETAWNIYPASHSLGTVSKLTNSTTSPATKIDANGFSHFLAYAEASDGVMASTINTDFINLEIELKANAQLNTRGKIIRVENFEGKVSGSVVENPHLGKWIRATTLAPPTSFSNENSQAYYDLMKLQDSGRFVAQATISGEHAEQLFSFNLIEAVERNIGKIPAADVAGKVAWLRANMWFFSITWYGFGSGPTGSIAKARIWDKIANAWSTLTREVTGTTIQKAVFNRLSFNNDSSYEQANIRFVDDSGFFHLLAYAEPSDGTTASTINTDYIEMEIELKPTANFSNPKVPLYEITKEDFDKIGVSWTDQDTLNRFPLVEGTQHLLNPYVMAEGENLLPANLIESPNYSTQTAYANQVEYGNYSLKYLGDGIYLTYLVVDVIPNQNYEFKIESNDPVNGGIAVFDDNVNLIVTYTYGAKPVIKFNSGNRNKVRLYFRKASGVPSVTFTNWILSLGWNDRPFTPRNPSYLYAETKLGAIGTAKDVLFRQDAQWKRRKAVEKDKDLSGAIAWNNAATYLGFKKASTTITPTGNSTDSRVYGNLGQIINKVIQWTGGNLYLFNGTAFEITAANEMTGFAEAYTPAANDWKRYFNGWKYTDGITWTSVTGNGQTATAQQALDTKPTDYTPYKLSYVLATPVIENVNVEGDIVADGLTQMETGAGVIVREKVMPKLVSGNTYYINHIPLNNKLTQKPAKFIQVFKNGSTDYSWTPYAHANFNGGLGMQSTNFDASAEYTVTYLALDKPRLTLNPVNLKAIYAKTIRSAHDDMAVKVGDLVTITSVNVRAIAELYKRMNALGG